MLEQNVTLEQKTVLVTGAAGFIGAALAAALLRTGAGIRVVGLDDLNGYYEVALKEYRLAQIRETAESQSDAGWTFVRADIADRDALEGVFSAYRPALVCHLAAQAGVRHSIEQPDAYIASNIIGFYNILEACRRYPVEHLLYASSSSVYGDSAAVPFSPADPADRPVSLYAATKRTDELLAHAYAKLYDIPCTGLRFFTVYGPAGRPDMAYFSFADKLVRGETIELFNYGDCSRDFTYVDDVVEGLLRVAVRAPKKAVGADGLPLPPYALYNLGAGRPERLLDFVTALSRSLIEAGVLPADYDLEAHKHLVPMQPGDVPVTFADTAALQRDFGFRPQTELREGLAAFARWYRAYRG